jgi:hypothetical protein
VFPPERWTWGRGPYCWISGYRLESKASAKHAGANNTTAAKNKPNTAKWMGRIFCLTFV